MKLVENQSTSIGCDFIDGEKPPLVKPGIYDFAFDYYETILLFGRAPKLVLWFRIMQMGEYNGLRLPRYYNVKRIVGKPHRNGDFRVGWKADFIREYVNLFSLPQRIDRIAMAGYKKYIIRGKVKTVTNDLKQRGIPKPLQYSVIQEIRGKKEL